MERDLFAHLPSEIITNILSRLPARAIAVSKCVCKPWLALLETDDFVNSYHSKSAAAVAVSLPETRDSYLCKVFEFDCDLESHNPITEFHFPRKATFDDSADGLLFLYHSEVSFDALFICNPITREFVELHFRHEFAHSNHDRRVAYGFGASKGSRQHKVVRLESESDYCHVYTLGTGRWRRVEAATASVSSLHGSAFANGTLYRIVSDSKGNTWICCFDMETERFSTISLPPVRGDLLDFDLVTLRDCLYAEDDSTEDEIVLWLLNECGGQKSWTMAYKIDLHPDCDVFGFNLVIPLQVSKNGDILLLCEEEDFFCYSIKTRTYREIPCLGASGIHFIIIPFLLTPSFRSLKRYFGMENVITF